VRVTTALPQTATGRIRKNPLRREGWWAGGDPVFHRSRGALEYVPLDDATREELRSELRRHGREALLGS
jgi:hypothetical protein